MTDTSPRAKITDTLARAGFISADDEADQLMARANGDRGLLATLVERRLTGEPLAWITGQTRFCDRVVHVDPGVYVPRWLSEPLALRAVKRLPDDGVGIDICTGAGAIAASMLAAHPHAHVVATEIDERAAACARSNGVEVFVGDLFAPLPSALEGTADVVVGVVPYVPIDDLALLQRDTFTFETTLAYAGGDDGMTFLRRAIAESRRFLRDRGVLLLEIGGDQHVAMEQELLNAGFGDISVLSDEDGDVRGIEATFVRPTPTQRRATTRG